MKVLSGSLAVAEAIKVCKPQVVPAFPITPQTKISEKISEMISNGEIDAEFIKVESEHSAISAAIGASSTGVRTYTATSSQGLALMHEMLFVASGLRLPIVMGVANRSLSAPLSIWNDQQDSFSSRDSGWMQLYVENAQEALDTHIMAYKIAEQVNVPIMVCLDGFVVSHTYENVELVEQSVVDRFLPKYKPKIFLNPKKPMTIGPVATPEYYMEFKKQQDEAMKEAHDVIKTTNKEFGELTGRKYGDGLIETINLDGKDCALITIGSLTGTARELQKETEFGIIKIKSLRPFPAKEIAKACSGLKSVGVVEKDISLGANGALYDEVRSALYSSDERPNVSGFIAGLGGKDITTNDLKNVLKQVKSGKDGVSWLM